MDEFPEDDEQAWYQSGREEECLRAIRNLPGTDNIPEFTKLVNALAGRTLRELNQTSYWLASGVPIKSIMLRLGITIGTPLEQIQQVCEAIEERKERDANS